MAFTDNSDLFGSVHEDGINLVVRHIMRQRPSLFNYATAIFREREDLFCEKIDPAPSVLEAGNPLFTEQAPLPIPGTPVPMGVNFCLQLTHLEIDFHPGNVFVLPPELEVLAPQRVALRARACAGLDCPSDDVIAEFLPAIEGLLYAQMVAAGELEEGKMEEAEKRRLQASSGHASAGAAGQGAVLATRASVLAPSATRFGLSFGRDQEIVVLPTRELICFCLELYAVGHFEWGTVQGSQQQWLKPKMDGIEIVDLRPEPMENAIECYLLTMLRLGVLPGLMVPMEKMILDITAMLADQGQAIGQQVTLAPAAVPGDVPNNPAIEDDQVKVFINLNVVEGGP